MRHRTFICDHGKFLWYTCSKCKREIYQAAIIFFQMVEKYMQIGLHGVGIFKNSIAWSKILVENSSILIFRVDVHSKRLFLMLGIFMRVLPLFNTLKVNTLTLILMGSYFMVSGSLI